MNWDLSFEKDFEKLGKCELFLLDMDGTLYLGDEVFDGAVDFINTLSELGKKYIYLTNNSSRAGIDYITRLKRLGFPCEEENVYTSGMATAKYLKDIFGDRYIYVVGTRTFYNELKTAGLKVFNSSDYDGVLHGDVANVKSAGNSDIKDGADNQDRMINPLSDDERELLIILLSLPDKLEFDDNNYNMCIKIKKMINQIDKVRFTKLS